MDALAQAWEFLEEHGGGYERYLAGVLAEGGVVVSGPRLVLMFVVRERVAHVVFACGDMGMLVRFGAANGGVYGYDAVEWERQLAGRRTPPRRFSIEQLWNRTNRNRESMPAGSFM